jgi:hypothetical protein
MEDFKVDLFKEEYKINFPNYIHLPESDCLELIRVISEKYKISVDSLAKELNSIQSFLGDVNAKDDFKLIDVLNRLSIKPPSQIYINWYRFDDIDVFDIIDLDKYFYDIWFSSSDDIDLFDESLDWIISIRHDGCISFVKV